MQHVKMNRRAKQNTLTRHKRECADDCQRRRRAVGAAISLDSGDEDNWDHNNMQYVNSKVWGHREGPKKERSADHFLITIQDLFPCLMQIFQTCGCARPRSKRVLLKKKKELIGPKIESICLDCGNVLDVKELPKSIAIDMFDRGTPQRQQAFLDLQEKQFQSDAFSDKFNFSGYPDWSVTASSIGGPTSRRGNYVPLPEFEPAPARTFQNIPQSPHAIGSVAPEGYSLDRTGHVALPEFPR